MTHFLDVVRKAGFDFDVASPQGGKVSLDEKSTETLTSDSINARFMADPDFVRQLDNSLKCGEVDPSRYAALYLSGGHGTVFDFRQSADLQRLITQVYSAGHPVTGVCHGVCGFIDSVDDKGAKTASRDAPANARGSACCQTKVEMSGSAPS